MKRILALVLAAALALGGCGAAPAAGQARPSSAPPSPPAASAAESGSPAAVWPTPQQYVHSVVQGCLDEFYDPSMDEFHKVRSAYDYLIAKGTYTTPAALDVWRFRSAGGPAPGYLENRSLSMLLWGLGTCEDYAAALYMLLTAMGLQARYIPGLTYTTAGTLCDHAWNQVRIDGVWYNLDCELDAGIRKNGRVSYRYFLNSDAAMARSHLWGQRLVDSGRLQPDQNAELEAHYLGERCPRDCPKPDPRVIPAAAPLTAAEVEARLRPELEAYEAANGPLAPLPIDREPPVFGRYHGYNRESLSWYDPQEFLRRDAETVMIR